MLYQTENPHGGDLYGRAVSLDFSANPNPLGTPPAVMGAVVDSARLLNQYPDPYCRELVAPWPPLRAFRNPTSSAAAGRRS